REIKFDRLWQRAAALGADFIATGHYARIERGGDGSYQLLRARDTSKDQSYFLFTLGQRELARTLFPLGAMTKLEVRARARALGLANADKPESQEICFVGDGDYAGFVERNAPAGQVRAGRVFDTNGRQMGTHQGVHRFTVGQRRGLGLATGEPLYVRAIDAATADITVAPRPGLMSAGLLATRVSLVNPQTASAGQLPVEVKIRYRHPTLPATVRMLDDERAEVRFQQSGPAVTPGQACVFYRGDEILGGGFIEAGLAL
ncbi:MAG TPA: aminomethyltransferase beta-barrel domain-containing protein, partial [Candidatus Binataceae bacterium]|nr:aminomethyltransferase beta-barrel domain-containing protein [Candidatus Binataceae bacterium]